MDKKAEIIFINVGYGESIIVRSGSKTLLIDGGSNEADEYVGKSGRTRAVDFLRSEGISHLDAVIVTHVHEDHLCGLLPVIQEIDVEKIFLPFPLVKAPGKICMKQPLKENLQKSLAALNDFLQLNSVVSPDKFIDVGFEYIQLGDILVRNITGLNPNCPDIYKAINILAASSAEDEKMTCLKSIDAGMNNCSLVLQLDIFGQKVLLPGDSNAERLESLLERSPDILKADIFKIGHHGQADSITTRLIDAIEPELVICSASNDGRYGSYNVLLRDELSKRDISFIRTDPDLSFEKARRGISLMFSEHSREVMMRCIDQDFFEGKVRCAALGAE